MDANNPTNNKTDLASPFTLKNGHTIKNRFMKAATSEQLSDAQHNPTKALKNVYSMWSKGGAGLLITGNIMIDRTALGEPRNVVLDDKSDLTAFKNWAKVATTNGAQCWAQLNHPGKQIPIYLSSQTVSSSAVPLNMGALSKGFATPRALKNDEIWQLIEKFAHSATLAKQVGFTGVQIHAAHGYLINQFLSPQHNLREDDWGGSLTNRMAFLLEVYKAVRTKVGDNYPISIKLNSADFQKAGFSEDDSMNVAIELTKLGIDHIEISGGTYESQAMTGNEVVLNSKKTPVKESTKKREAYFLAFAEKLRKVTDVPITVTGGFRSAETMQAAINSGATDLVGLARPMMLFPDLPNQAMENSSYVAYFNEPTTGIKFVDETAMLSLTWYEEQIHRMGKIQQPNPNLNAWVCVVQTYLRMGKNAFVKRRA